MLTRTMLGSTPESRKRASEEEPHGQQQQRPPRLRAPEALSYSTRLGAGTQLLRTYHGAPAYLSVIPANVASLEIGAWVDDVAIEARLQHVWDTLDASTRLRVALLPPHFLMSLPVSSAAYVDAFSLTFAFVPVNTGPDDMHWSTAVVIDGCDVLHIDSVPVDRGGHDTDTILAPLVEWLTDRARSSGRPTDIRMHRIQGTPRQKNSTDCGAYVLMVIELLCREIKGDVDRDLAHALRSLTAHLCALAPAASAAAAGKPAAMVAAFRQQRTSAVAAANERRPFLQGGPSFMTGKWFTHADAQRVRVDTAEALIRSSEAQAG